MLCSCRYLVTNVHRGAPNNRGAHKGHHAHYAPYDYSLPPFNLRKICQLISINQEELTIGHGHLLFRFVDLSQLSSLSRLLRSSCGGLDRVCALRALKKDRREAREVFTGRLKRPRREARKARCCHLRE